MLQHSSSRKHIRPEVELLLESARSTGDWDTYSGKRASLRITEALQLEVKTEQPRQPGPHATTMQNISETGCAFWFRNNLDRGTKIFIREFTGDSSMPWIEAFVARCTQGLKGYLVGVRFDLPKC